MGIAPPEWLKNEIEESKMSQRAKRPAAVARCRTLPVWAAVMIVAAVWPAGGEPRNEVSYLRGPYNASLETGAT